jgi:hypothetical protein
VQQLQQNMVFCAKTSYGCGSLQNMPQHMVLCTISSLGGNSAGGDDPLIASSLLKMVMDA